MVEIMVIMIVCFCRAKLRLERAKEELAVDDTTRTARRQELLKKIHAMSIYCSQIGDTRPISYCEFSPNSEMLVTGSWYVTSVPSSLGVSPVENSSSQ